MPSHPSFHNRLLIWLWLMISICLTKWIATTPLLANFRNSTPPAWLSPIINQPKPQILYIIPDIDYPNLGWNANAHGIYSIMYT